MSDHQTLENTINTMVSSLEIMKDEKVTLDQMMQEFMRAIESYKSFQVILSNENLDVLEIKADKAGSLTESNFEWRDM